MKTCPKCYARHEDEVTVCDCGQNLPTARELEKERKKVGGLRSPENQKALIWGCGITGALIIFIIDKAMSDPLPPASTAAGVAGSLLGSAISVGGTTFGGFLLGGLVACIILLLIPKERIPCVKCDSPKAMKSYKSIWDGKKRPNQCPECKHQW